MARIDYQSLLDNALKSVVREALIHAQINGLGDGMHFFITFRTHDAGVVLPDFLRIRYPDIMTIVLQYSYNNLHVSDKEFGVCCGDAVANAKVLDDAVEELATITGQKPIITKAKKSIANFKLLHRLIP